MPVDDFREQIAEYKREQAEATQRDYRIGEKLRHIRNAKILLDHAILRRPDEDVKILPEYTRLKIWVDSIQEQVDLPCYRADPILWDTFVSQYQPTRVLSVRAVKAILSAK